MIDLRSFKALTFDCYGTIIDWETGILAALENVRRDNALELGDEAVLTEFGKAEAALEEATPGAPYPEILAGVYKDLAGSWCVDVDDDAARAFAASIADWPPFDDSKAALEYLGEHYVLGVLSNVDNASFELSRQRLGIEFDEVMTAEEIGSYKPDPANFVFALDRLAKRGIERSEVLHVAQSLYHDHEPAKGLGLATVWVNRRAGRSGSGATRPVETHVKPDLEVPDLATLVERHRAAG